MRHERLLLQIQWVSTSFNIHGTFAVVIFLNSILWSPQHWHCTMYLWFSFWSRFCKLLAIFFSETSFFAGFSFSLQEPFNKEEYLNSAFTVFKDTGQSPRSEWTTLVPVVAPVINFHVYTDQWSLSLTCADMKRSEFYCEYEYLLPQTCHPQPAIKGHKPHKSTQKNFLSIPV